MLWYTRAGRGKFKRKPPFCLAATAPPPPKRDVWHRRGPGRKPGSREKRASGLSRSVCLHRAAQCLDRVAVVQLRSLRLPLGEAGAELEATHWGPAPHLHGTGVGLGIAGVGLGIAAFDGPPPPPRPCSRLYTALTKDRHAAVQMYAMRTSSALVIRKPRSRNPAGLACRRIKKNLRHAAVATVAYRRSKSIK